jgi:hypothetical protein
VGEILFQTILTPMFMGVPTLDGGYGRMEARPVPGNGQPTMQFGTTSIEQKLALEDAAQFARRQSEMMNLIGEGQTDEVAFNTVFAPHLLEGSAQE